MPAKSDAQRRLMLAALHGADFKKARDLRKSMTLRQIGDYVKSAVKQTPKAQHG